MANRNKKTLKTFFQTGKIPNQEQYADLIDSQLNQTDTDSQTISSDLTINGDVDINGSLEVNSIDTGLGDFEIGQNLRTTDNVTFSNIFASGSNGHITASGNVSASGTITAATGSFSHLIGNSPITVGDQVTFQQPITASTDISASGNLTAANLTLSGDITSVGDDVTIGDVLNVGSHITASGNISSSKDVIANTGSFNHLSLNGDIIANNLTATSTGSFEELHANNISASGVFSSPLTIGPKADTFGGSQLTLKASSFGFATRFIFNVAAKNSYTIGTTIAQQSQGGRGNFYITSGSTTTPTIDSKIILFATGSNSNVGIATKEPTEKLTVHGNLLVSGSGLGTGSFNELEATGNTTVDGDVFVSRYIRHTGDNDTHIEFLDNKIQLHAGNLPFITIDKDASTPFPLTINNGGNRINFRVQDKNSDLLLKTDSEAFKVNLYHAGNQKLETTADGINITGHITASSNLKIDGSQVDFTNLPTSDPRVSGRLYNDSGTLKISAG